MQVGFSSLGRTYRSDGQGDRLQLRANALDFLARAENIDGHLEQARIVEALDTISRSDMCDSHGVSFLTVRPPPLAVL